MRRGEHQQFRHPATTTTATTEQQQSLLIIEQGDNDDEEQAYYTEDDNPTNPTTNHHHHHHHPPDALPGRPRRRQPPPTRRRKKKLSGGLTKKNAPRKSPPSSTSHPLLQNSRIRITIAIILWYTLGILSIGTSKLLLSPTWHNNLKIRDYDRRRFAPVVGGVTPLLLSVQQFGYGVGILRVVLGRGWWEGGGGGGGVQMLPRSELGERNDANMEIMLCGIFFGLGFVTTNYSFHGSTAAFVETIKAAEPLTSATLAVLWGIETLGNNEIMSLLTIVVGVLLSTLGNSNSHQHHSSRHGMVSSFTSCFIVMVANLCFSLRGLRQKILRNLPQGKRDKIDDINLQYRMQQMGVFVFLIPALLFELPAAISTIWNVNRDHGLITSGILLKYVILSSVNGFAFTSYNLASTYILTRISVVHHAALNCIRRVFAIIVTSLMFSVPFTVTGVFGVFVSVVGFLSFTHFKFERQRQPKPLSSLLPMSVL